MKLTVITDAQGALVGFGEQQPHAEAVGPFRVEVTIDPIEGHSVQEIEVPDHMRRIAPEKLLEHVRSCLPHRA